MKPSIRTIRSLGLASVFEDLYFGRKVPGNLGIYMSYPRELVGLSLDDAGPLTDGRLIPLVGDGDFSQLCLYDPDAKLFITKVIQEPAEVVESFQSWQHYLGGVLLGICDSGEDREEIKKISKAIGFHYSKELFELLDELEDTPGDHQATFEEIKRRFFGRINS